MDGLAFKLCRSDFPYIFAPKALREAAVLSQVPKVGQAVVVWNLENNEQIPATVSKEFDWKILIGTSKAPAVTRPCKKKRDIDGNLKYHALWDKVSYTYLLIKGIEKHRIQTLVNSALYFGAQFPLSRKDKQRRFGVTGWLPKKL